MGAFIRITGLPRPTEAGGQVMIACYFDIKLCIQAPVISQSSGALTLGLDSAVQRDEQDQPALPGSLVRGNILQALNAFLKTAPTALSEDRINAWFGQESLEDSGNAPQRGRLFFDAWWSDKSSKQVASQTLYRIAIDPATGASEEGAIQMIESPYQRGQGVTFSGRINTWMSDDNERQCCQKWLKKALEYIPAMGAFKGVGFGHITGFELTAGQSEPDTSIEWPQTHERMNVRLTPDRPFCVGKPAVGENNRFDSETFLPGGMIIGAIAQRMRRDGREKFPALSEYIDLISVNHALPIAEDSSQIKRPVSVPLSTVSVKDEGEIAVHDVALCESAGLIASKAPDFQPDWKPKQWAAANAIYALGKTPKRGLTVRTKMQKDQNNTEEGGLFSMETIKPNGFRWLSSIDLGQIPGDKQDAVRNELQQLLSFGLDGLGKTSARATLQLTPADPMSNVTFKDGLAVICLQTPALLFEGMPSSDMQQAYANSWHQLSDGNLTLVRHFSQQALWGGTYWHQRFCPTNSDYKPQLMTLAGSVFVLRVKDEKVAAKKLQQWLRYGLPQRSGNSEKWDENPWINVNGFGEIALNQESHWNNKPDEEKWHAITL
jgi:hypothetical protein